MSLFRGEVYKKFVVSVNPASIGAAASAETAVTVPCDATDLILVQVPASLETGLAYSGVRVSAANTVQLRLTNVTSGAVDGIARNWTFVVIKGALAG